MAHPASGPSDLSLMEPTLSEYAGAEGSLIAILQKTQEIYGYLPEDVLAYISEKTGTPPAVIYGVATFYAQFRLNPVGKHLIMLCQGTACHVNSSELISNAITDELGIGDKETTKDGLFTMEHVACLGCCSLSPVMMVDGQAYGSLTPDKAKRILKDIAAKDREAAGSAKETGGDVA